MTNEQVALLLRSIAMQVQDLEVRVGSLITDAPRDVIKVWVGLGPQPDQPLFAGIKELFGAKDAHPYYVEENWEYKPEGEFIAVIAIETLATWLREQADELVKCGKVGE